MLFDPFEKEFHLPTAFVKLCNGERRQRKIVGQKYQPFFCDVVEEFNAPKFVWIIFLGVEVVQDNGFISKQSLIFIDGV